MRDSRTADRPRGILAALGLAGLVGVAAAPPVAVLALEFSRTPLLATAATASLLGAALVALLALRRHERALARATGSALTDPLTGAPNRAAFERVLDAERARIARGGQPAGVFVVDLDRFKSVNDRYGHLVGDAVLVAVVARLAACVRPYDVVCRWGGEELAVLAPDQAGDDELRAFAERLRRAVADEPIVVGFRTLPVTVSVGAALLDASVVPEQALARADEALYRAKRLRNAVAIEHGTRRRRAA